MTKYVATSLTGDESVALHDAAAEVGKLKQQDVPTLLVQGSSNLLQTLLAEGLIDSYRLFVFPLVLGKGKRFFASGTAPAAFKQIDSKTSPSGVTMNNHERVRNIEPGSFATAEPTEEEVAQRSKMAREG